MRVIFSVIFFCTAITSSAGRSRIAIPELENKIVSLVNAERQARNLNPFELDETLSRIARAHSRDMASREFFDHINPDGEAPRDRLRQAGYHCPKTVGENIFQNNLYSRVTISGNRKTYDWNSLEKIAGSTVGGWMQSSGHRKNILHTGYRKTGVGAAIAADGQVYITQLFCG